MRKISFVVALVVLTAAALLPGDGVAAAGSGNSITTPDPVSPFSTSLKLDSAGFPVVAYTWDGTNENLKLLRCNDANCANGDDSITVADTGVMRTPSLALDGAGNPVVAYYDAVNEDLKILHCNDAICDPAVGPDDLPPAGTDPDSITTPDSVGNVGQTPSLALDISNFPVVAYHDYSNIGDGDLKVMHCNDTNCSGGNETFASPDTIGWTGSGPSLKLDASGFPVIAYYSPDARKDLHVLHCGNAFCSAGNTITTPDSGGDVGSGASLVLDSAGRPVMSYWDQTNGNTKVLHCDDAACVGDESANMSVPDTSGDAGPWSSVAVDGSDRPVVSYSYYLNESNLSIRIQHCGDVTCTSGNTVAEIDPWGNYLSMVLDILGRPVVSASFPGLRIVHCGSTTCSNTKTPSGLDVQVEPYAGVTITFDNVVAPGTTTVTSGNSGFAPPIGFQVSNTPTYYEISSTAGFAGSVKVCLPYNDAGLGPLEETVRVIHNGTELPPNDKFPLANPDTVNNIVCANVTSFSPFVVATLTPGDDYDGDGCSNGDEVGPNELLGGQRDAYDPHDYFNPTGDGKNRVDDILAVVYAYFNDDDDGNPGLPPYQPGYNPNTDRSNTAGSPNAWNTGAPDGLQRVQDIVHAVNSYFHDCA